MAQLYYNFGSMNCGKSAALLQVANNYKERGMRTMLFTYSGDGRFGYGKIASRTGLESYANLFSPELDLLNTVEVARHSNNISCVLVDEAQFLTKDQVTQLALVADQLDIAVICYGIRTDFRGELFEGSAALFAMADKISELKTICHCGKKATMILRVDEDGKALRDGPQVQIGGNESYISVCRKHFFSGETSMEKEEPVEEPYYKYGEEEDEECGWKPYNKYNKYNKDEECGWEPSDLYFVGRMNI